MRISRRILLCAVITVLLLSGGSALFGGSGYTLRCTDEKCGYVGQVNFGGGETFNQITGYCAHCRAFVYLRWSNRLQPVGEGEAPKTPAPPKPLGTIWDASTGKDGTLYACPKCTDPFLAIPSEADLKCCPKCHQATLKAELVLAYD